MKSSLSFAAALLGAGLTGATPLAHGGMIYDVELEEAAVVPRKADHVVRDLDVQYVDKAQVCVIDIYRAGNPAGTPVTVNANFDFTSFCSAYLPNAGAVGAATTTVYFASSATTTGVAATVTATKTALTTITLPDPAHAQINYCPISNAGATCNITAWAGPTGAFHAGTEDFDTCHQLCLSTATCQSFQVSAVTGAGIIPQCNLYTVSAGGSFNGTKNFNLDPNAPFIVYDRACAWALPAGCNQQITTAAPVVVAPTLPPKTTAAPVKTTAVPYRSSTITTVVYVTYVPPSAPFSVGPGGVKRDVEPQVERELAQIEEKGLEARDSQVIPPPWILSLIGTVTLSQICTCVLGGVAGSGPQATIYLPSYNYATSTPTVTATYTKVNTVTSLLASGTIWSSVP
ncbi:hypothetical protein N431DRAFT_544272 [Stipitochalara longipes BDJ]|nr:hypothetical protein N431DRAFT_544272 [Stipitochalara longipes BDJ]